LLNRIVGAQPLDDVPPSVAFVWYVPLACTASAEQRLSEFLDPVEAARAARFASRDERRRHVVSHGVLRLILSAFTRCDPRAIHIAATTAGKPYVVGRGPHFSLSHCGDVALVAVTRGGPTGVDVERVRSDLELDTFARPLVSAPDIARIEARAPEARRREWFQAWARLEAVAKASGEGLREDSVANIGGPVPFRIWNLDIDDARVGAFAAAPPVEHVVYEVIPDISSALMRFAPA
jgi:4'-phosphopantetheinyl transferase